MAQTEYKLVSNNLITNSTFDSGIQNWTVSNPVSNGLGWRWENTFTYGTNLWIDNGPGIFTATSNAMSLCVGYPKRVKFSFASSNTGGYEMIVKLGGQIIGTLTQSGIAAQSIFTPVEGVIDHITVFYNYWPSHYVTDGKINNNIWHDFVLTIPDYQGTTSATLTFEYTKTGISRMVYLDNVEVYEVIPTPVPTNTNVYLSSCDAGTTYNLNTLNPSDTRYTYTWYIDATHTTIVSDPTKVGVGAYYLFATDNCNGTTKYSFPSTVVNVHSMPGCCGGNVVMDGGFDQYQMAGSYRIPLGDNTNGGGIYWKRNFTNNDGEFHITPNITLGTQKLNAVKFTDAALRYNKTIYQKNSKISRWGTKIIEFDLAISSHTLASFFAVYLKPDIPNLYSNLDRSDLGNHLLLIYKNGFGGSWYIPGLDGIPNGVKVWLDGQPAVTGYSPNYSNNRFYRITIEVPINFGNSGSDYFGGIAFWSGNRVTKYIDNVSVTVSLPERPILTTATVAGNCPDGLANLYSLGAGNITNRQVGWDYYFFYENSSVGARVKDPTQAPPGTYYMFAYNKDLECYSTQGTAVTVTKSCPEVKGSVYDDWDGVIGGIANKTTVQNSVLYVHLVNPTNNLVLKSTQLKADGTYTMTGAVNTPYRAVLSDRNAAVGNPAPAYIPGVIPTGETVNGATEVLPEKPDGRSAQFTTGANASSITIVNFGANRVPMQDNISFSGCVSVAEKLIQLSSIDSEPNWNNGAGKKLTLQNIALTNGKIYYNGVEINGTSHTTTAYDPTKLIFRRTDPTIKGTLTFDYAFEDAAGHSTLNVVNPPEPAKASYELKATPAIDDKVINVSSGEQFSHTPVHGTDGVVPVGSTYSWDPVETQILGVGGIASGTNQTSVSGTLYNYCAYEHTIHYLVTAQSPDGCLSTFQVTVNVAAASDNCGEIWYGLDGNTATLLDLGKVIDIPVGNKGNLSAPVFNIPTTGMSGTSAIAIYNTAPHHVYYVPSNGTTSATHVYLYNNQVSTGNPQVFRALPTGVTNVNGMAFDKNGNLWIVDSSNTMWVLSATSAFGVTPTTWGTTWTNRGTIIGIPSGGVGDIAFNWTGSMYVVGNDASNNGHLYVINPLELAGSNNANAEQIVQITTGRTLTGVASHLDLETFFISATDGADSYMYELSMKTGGSVTLLKTHTGKVIGDLASCCLPQNLWVGTIDTDWNTPSNWIYDIVPRTGEDIEFANGYANNAKGKTTLNDLEIPSGTAKVIGSLINETDSFGTIISAGSSLTVRGKVIGSQTDPSKLFIKADGRKVGQDGLTDESQRHPNGTLILAGQPCDDVVMGAVQLYAKGVKGNEETWTDNIVGSPTEGQSFTTSYQWQYFGVPVKSIVANPTFLGASLRMYDEAYNGDNTKFYQKWHWLNSNSVLEAFKGYSITQEEATTYTIAGELNFCDKTVTMTRQAPEVTGATGYVRNVRYGLGQNLFGNSYTAAIDINQLTFPAEVESTVYLYNTGRFHDWATTGKMTIDTTQLSAGNWFAIPKNASPAVWDHQIPSMQGFMLKFTDAVLEAGPGAPVTINIPYTTAGELKVLPNTKPQLAPKQHRQRATKNIEIEQEQSSPLSYLRINLESASTRDALWLISQEGTTNCFDNGWDGRKYFGTPTAFIFTENKDGLMQVNADKTIDGSIISFYANADTEYELTLIKSNLEQYTNLHLHDLVNETSLALDSDTTYYRFTAVNNGNVEKRFVILNSHKLKLKNDLMSPLDAYLKQDNLLVITNLSGSEGQITLYNVAGGNLFSQHMATGVTEIPLNLSKGIYLVSLQAAGNRETVKIVVRLN